MRRFEFKKKWIALFLCLSLMLSLIVILSTVNILADDTPTLSPYETIFTDDSGNQITKAIFPLGPQPPVKSVADIPDVHKAGSINSLSDVPAFDWSYGCSATSAAMLFGYYDRTGYSDFYTGPTNGGVCPLDNSVWGQTVYPSVTCGESPINATHQGIDGRVATGHVDDYWIDSGEDGPDPYFGNWAEHTADCAGDYMGTNQWRYSNTDGSTSFYWYTNGDPLPDYTGCEPGDRDGCHGMRLFAESRGYTVLTNFTQMIQGQGSNPALGFTYANFQAEIDAGRPVLIQVTGHTMLGYGYDTSSNLIYIHDTWDYSNHTMTWGGYYEGLLHKAVTVIHLATAPSPTYSIDVTAPNGSESWNANSTQTITWTSSGVTGNVRIDVSRDGGSTWSTIFASTPDDHSQNWVVTGPPTTTAKIKITSLNNHAIYDESDDDFTIVQSITVTAPNGGETWNYNATQTANWTSVGIKTSDKVKIEISRNGTGGPWTTIVASATNTGSKTWKVTGPGTTLARIRVSMVSDATVTDTSDADFTINPPTITLTSPVGGETWDYNTTHAITWTAAGWASSDKVKIELSRNSGSTWTTIVASATNTGSRVWKVTGPGTSQARIKVSMVTDPTVTDESAGDFTIEPPHIFLDIPDAGSITWDYNTTQTITWHTTGFASSDKVKIELSRDSGSNWTTIVASASNTGSKTWKVTSPGTPNARIRVSMVTDPSVNDMSANDFTIEPPHIFLDSPVGGETWDYNTSQTITWHTTGFASSDKVKIEISRDGGVTWATLFASLSNTGSRIWKVTGPGTALARIRVSMVSDATVTDTSDANFNINPPTITLMTPNGGTECDYNDSLTIGWTWTGFASKDKVKIDISRDGGVTWATLFASLSNTGSKIWKVTGPNTTQARIRVSMVSDATVNDTSDADFTIKLPTLTVTSPTDPNDWIINSTHAITWTSTGIPTSQKVKIEISRDGGSTWTTIIASTPNDGTHNWKVTGAATTDVIIRITSVTYPTIYDDSDPFDISTS
jgi:5-hydroxyisourate hydrolase-like protein (transthyretin family)